MPTHFSDSLIVLFFHNNFYVNIYHIFLVMVFAFDFFYLPRLI